MGKGLDQLEDLKDDSIRYVKLKWTSVRLSAAEKMSTMVSRMFGYVASLLILFVAVIFLLVALALWLGDILGHVSFGFLISGGVFLLAGVIVYLVRDRLVINTMVRHFIDMFFTDKETENGTRE